MLGWANSTLWIWAWVAAELVKLSTLPHHTTPPELALQHCHGEGAEPTHPNAEACKRWGPGKMQDQLSRGLQLGWVGPALPDHLSKGWGPHLLNSHLQGQHSHTGGRGWGRQSSSFATGGEGRGKASSPTLPRQGVKPTLSPHSLGLSPKTTSK